MPNLSEIEAHANPVRKGAWTLVLTPSLHRDPEVWGPDPEAFGPEFNAVLPATPVTLTPC